MNDSVENCVTTVCIDQDAPSTSQENLTNVRKFPPDFQAKCMHCVHSMENAERAWNVMNSFVQRLSHLQTLENENEQLNRINREQQTYMANQRQRYQNADDELARSRAKITDLEDRLHCIGVQNQRVLDKANEAQEAANLWRKKYDVSQQLVIELEQKARENHQFQMSSMAVAATFSKNHDLVEAKNVTLEARVEELIRENEELRRKINDLECRMRVVEQTNAAASVNGVSSVKERHGRCSVRQQSTTASDHGVTHSRAATVVASNGIIDEPMIRPRDEVTPTASAISVDENSAAVNTSRKRKTTAIEKDASTAKKLREAADTRDVFRATLPPSPLSSCNTTPRSMTFYKQPMSPIMTPPSAIVDVSFVYSKKTSVKQMKAKKIFQASFFSEMNVMPLLEELQMNFDSYAKKSIAPIVVFAAPPAVSNVDVDAVDEETINVATASDTIKENHVDMQSNTDAEPNAVVVNSLSKTPEKSNTKPNLVMVNSPPKKFEKLVFGLEDSDNDAGLSDMDESGVLQIVEDDSL